MKATLVYELPKDREEYNRAMRADHMAGFIWDFEQYLRSEVKHNGMDEKILDNWHQMKHDNDINIDELWS